MVLYHYVHCPYCLRVRMALGFLNISFKSVVLPYEDEKTPIELTGKKMLPIFEFQDQSMNESSDIIQKLDIEKKIKFTQSFDDLEELTKQIGKFVHPLAMPIWVYTKEFSDSSRSYFLEKKIKSKGPFKHLHEKREIFIKLAYEFFNENKDLFSLNDENLGDKIFISSHLYGLYMVPDFSFPEFVHQYIQDTKQKCNFDYHVDFWS